MEFDSETETLCIIDWEECQAAPGTQTLCDWKMEQKSHGKRKEECKSF